MDTIDRLDPISISYVDFFFDYLLQNKPCIFKCSVSEEWRACKEWRRPDGSPNIEYLVANFGDANVPVVSMNQNSGYDTQEQHRMMMRDFLRDHFDCGKDKEGDCLYLKDWHFVKDFPTYNAYRLPIYFGNDWMNEYWDSKNDPVESDYRFVYIGGKNTWTAFHADVFRSYSWSANVCGRKRWLLVRPGVESEIRKRWESEDKSNMSTPMTDIRDVLERYPEFGANGDVIDIVQNPGEIIFVPSNWHHQVHNLDSVISINHNWCNGANIGHIWRYLCHRLDAVEKELSDCRSIIDDHEWFNQCQIVLKCDMGMDYEELLSLLALVIKRRLEKLESRFQSSKALQESLVRIVIDCARSSNGHDSVKGRLKEICTCHATSPAQCDSCANFFDLYDIIVAQRIMRKILETRDCPLSLWRDRMTEIDAKVSCYVPV